MLFLFQRKDKNKSITMFIKIWCIKVTFVGVSTLPKYWFLVNQSLEVEGLGSCILNIVSKNLDVKV